MEPLTGTERALAAICDGREMIHQFARVLAHEWREAEPADVAIRLWRALPQQTRDAEVIASIAEAYDTWGKFLEAKHGRLPRAGDVCEGTTEMVLDLAEAEAQRTIALTVELERDGEFLESPTWGYTVQSWAIATGRPYETRQALSMDAADADSACMGGTTPNFEADLDRPAYLNWISDRKADEAHFTTFDPEGDHVVFVLAFGRAWAEITRYDGDVVFSSSHTGSAAVEEEHRAELARVIHGAARMIDYDRWSVAYDLLDLKGSDQSAAWGGEPVEQWTNIETGEVRYYTPELAAQELDSDWRNDTKGLAWMSPEDAYSTVIRFALTYDEMWDPDEESLPADEIADHILALLEGSAVLERTLDGLASVEPDTARTLERNHRVADKAADHRATTLSCLRGYLERHIQLEREEPTESFQEQDRKALARRVPRGFKSVARYAREVAKDSDMSSRALADYLVGVVLDEDQRKRLLSSGVDDCWHLANLLAVEIRAERGEERQHEEPSHAWAS